MTRHPTDVGRTPEDIFVFEIENPLCGDVCLQKIAGGRVQYSFRLSCRARGVKNIEWMLAIEVFGGTVTADGLHQLVPPEIAPGLHMQR